MATADPKRVQRLQAGADAGAINLPATERAPLPSAKVPLAAVKVRDAKDAPPTSTCQQTLTLSFFFDGTGNNLDADVNTWEHSNVARLYRSHLEDDEAKGVYKFYLAGIGTLFKDREVDDPGGTMFGPAFGAQGQARLDFAFARLREKVQQAEARAENPTNKICWIKVSAFGFSRGAALARAFCRDLQKRCEQDAGSSTGWRLKQGRYPIEITFLGLFDTVASAGLPPSSNNLSRNRYVKAAGWATNPLGTAAAKLLGTPELKQLAFGAPGADPAPGLADGHAAWAKGMQIGAMVQRCVHMMASHENRNSFALDSTLYEVAPNSLKFTFPSSVSESFCPGVHSDVGGGYRPGEGGCKPERGAQLSLIPLRAMHAEAVNHVPLRPLSAIRDQAQREDFALDPEGAKHFAHMLDLVEAYRARAASVSVPGTSSKNGFGAQLNGHMRLYYAWRFRAIRLKAQAEKAKQPTPREAHIAQQEKQFATQRAALAKELKQARSDLYAAQNREELSRILMENARMNKQRYGTPINPSLVQQQEAARRDVEQKQIAYDRVRARVSTAANDSELAAAMDKYGRMLFEDAKQIVEWQREDPKLKLRPHYAAVVEAYLDEFERGKGLSETADAKLIELFEHYVHDSLAGFDTDETWPSDPRIVYVGGDNKLRYAFAPIDGSNTGSTQAA
jgi:Uncharacterized alpha/beta hydrolase domain (DUF2235)